MSHSDVQKHVSCTGLHRRLLIYYGLCLETAGNVFPTVFDGLIPITLNFSALCDVHTVKRHYTVLFKGNRIFCQIIFRN